MSSENIHTIEKRLIPRKKKAEFLGHRGGVFWMCGLSGSGKSTLAISLEKSLLKEGINSIILDGDNLRAGLNKDLGFSMIERMENIRRVSEVAKIMVSNGMIVIVSLISPTIELRECARQIIGEEDFFEIFVRSSFEKCQQRDVKGLYEKSLKGEIKSFTGKDSQFEEPLNPWLIIDTEITTETDSMTELLAEVLKKIR